MSDILYTSRSDGRCPQKLPLLSGGSGPPANTGFLGAIQVHIPKGISVGSAVLAQLMIVINRHTNHRTLVTKGHIWLSCNRHTHSIFMTIFHVKLGQLVVPYFSYSTCAEPKKNIRERYDTIRDAILTCTRKPT